MPRPNLFPLVLAAAAVALASCQQMPDQRAGAGAAPKFAVDPAWPKPLPENWILGQVAGIAVDKDDRIWVLHRPTTLVDDEKGAMANPPTTKCCRPAPAVLQFDADGNLTDTASREQVAALVAELAAWTRLLRRA